MVYVYPYLGFKKQCKRVPIAFPPQHQPMQPWFEHLMVPRPIFDDPDYKGSTIINTTSVTAYNGNKTLIDYSSTKGVIVSFTRSLALSLVSKGIRVNGVAPGPIWTLLMLQGRYFTNFSL